MKYFLWIISIVTLILLFPIPLKITLIYANEIFSLKIYNKTLIPSQEKKSRKNKSKKYIKTPEGEKISKLKLVDIKNILKFIINSKIKFSLKTTLNIDYSIEDAALSAVIYGLFYQCTAFIESILNLFFKVKNFKPSINMKYNENYFKFESSSIIFINIVKIIYIIGSIFYRYKKARNYSSYKNVN